MKTWEKPYTEATNAKEEEGEKDGKMWTGDKVEGKVGVTEAAGMTREVSASSKQVLRRVTDTQMLSSGPYDASPNLRNGIFSHEVVHCFSDIIQIIVASDTSACTVVHSEYMAGSPASKACFSKHQAALHKELSDNDIQVSALLVKGQDAAWNTHFELKWTADYLKRLLLVTKGGKTWDLG